MKKICFLYVIIFTTYGLYGQVLDTPKQPEKTKDEDNEIQTIFSHDEKDGGYFDIYLNYTQINDKDAIEIGSRIAYIINRSFGIGIEGAGFITDLHRDEYNNEYMLTGGYGGLLLEPIILPKFPVHISIPILLGGGAVVYAITEYGEDGYMEVDDVDGFLMARPGIEIELNITRFFRFCLNTHYRFTTELGTDRNPDFSEGLNDNFAFGISFKFGKF